MARILAIDTVLDACAVSVSNGKKTQSFYEPMGRGQTERLLPMILEACEAVGLELNHIDAVAVTRGPGSFTGVRVGLSVARTLSTIHNIPLYGLTTFEAISTLLDPHGDDKNTYGIALSSKRDDVYFQKQGETAYLSTVNDIRNEYPDLHIYGNVEGVEAIPLDALTASMIDAVERGLYEAGKLTPVYLRDADISKSKKSYRETDVSFG